MTNKKGRSSRLTINEAAAVAGASADALRAAIEKGTLASHTSTIDGHSEIFVTRRDLILAGFLSENRMTKLDRQLALAIKYLKGRSGKWHTTNELCWQGRLHAGESTKATDELQWTRPTSVDELRRQPLEAALAALRVVGLVEKVSAPLDRPGKPPGGSETLWRWIDSSRPTSLQNVDY